MFEANVVERFNSGQISLVVTCTTVCTCHHEVTLHRNQWNKSERKRSNTNWKWVFPVINDARGCADYWVLREGCQAPWSGGRRHSSPWVRSIPVGKRTLIHTRQIALCEPKSQTISNMRRSSYYHRDTSRSWRNASLSGGMASRDFFGLTLFMNIPNDTSS